ncbi:MAG: tRNA (adenosine(37)-N6)-threonylcarbamoyltransferase complex dimerization subunit type 1 TsaB [Peptostreptococcaceae bacterium]|nr:tRNA (adenosine(37)-N6)-threonylcarbamoyltransferase complex dimerization subunit type 1 TsaB [Peptostreptococcaceae bacterium]
MRVLAIDTSSSILSLGLMRDGVMIGESALNKPMSHSQELMPRIRHLFEGAGEKIRDVDLFAVTIGPGSFTGIRIGVATANAFAMANAKKVVGILTLEALAYNFSHSDAFIFTTMSAQREDYYRGVYSFDKDGELETVQKESVRDKQTIIGEIMMASKKKKVIIAGELADDLRKDERFFELLSDQDQQNNIIEIARSADNYIRGAVLCRIAADRKGSVSFVSPVYIRRPQAEEQYEARREKRGDHE